MFYIILSIAFLCTIVLLILSNTINIFPEIFFFSWLIKKGFVPYRDYFDDHGFLLQMFLAPFSGDITLLWLRVIYVVLHCVNLMLVLYILYKIRSKLAFIVGGILYVLLITYYSDNDFWFELFVTTFYLGTYALLLTRQFTSKFHLIGFFIGLATLVKPTAAIIIAPIFLFQRKIQMLLGFLFVLCISASYFVVTNGYSKLFDGIIGYNVVYSKFSHLSPFQGNKLIFTSIAIFFLCISYAFVNKKIKTLILPMIFTFSSYIFLTSGYSPPRMIPIVTFFVISIASTIPLLKNNVKTIFLLCITIYIGIMVFKVNQHHIYLQTHKPPYISLPIGQEIIAFINKNTIKEKFFILGDIVQPYYLLNQLPPTTIPVRFPLIEKFYPDYEQRLISDIQINNVVYVFYPKQNKFSWNLIPEYLNTNYSLIFQSETLGVYKKNTSP
jgi:hypothetical protein